MKNLREIVMVLSIEIMSTKFQDYPKIWESDILLYIGALELKKRVLGNHGSEHIG